MNPGRQAGRLRGVVASPPRPAGSLRSGHFLFLISPVWPQPAKSFLVPLPALPWHGSSILLLPGWDESLPRVPFGHDHAKETAASLPCSHGAMPMGTAASSREGLGQVPACRSQGEAGLWLCLQGQVPPGSALPSLPGACPGAGESIFFGAFFLAERGQSRGLAL